MPLIRPLAHRYMLCILLGSFLFIISCKGSDVWDIANRSVGTSDKAITSFQFLALQNSQLDQNIDAPISGSSIQPITPYTLDATALVSSFTTNGETVSVGGVEQQSGVTVNDFSSPLVYTVTATDGTTQEYTVTLDKSLLTEEYSVSLVSVSSFNDTITIGWQDPDVAAPFTINFYDAEDNDLIATVGKGTQTHTFSALTPGQYYRCFIRVVDNYGNQGPPVSAGALPTAALRNYTLISNAQELYDVRNNLSANYLVVAPIDLSGGYTGAPNWAPIGDNTLNFTGTFDGNGFVIRDLQIAAAIDYAGLFGYTSAADVRNVVLTAASVNGNNNCGLLAAYATNTTLRDCSVRGSISGAMVTGGLLGTLSGGSAERCSANVIVTGMADIVGGFVGEISGDYTLTTCISRGSVTVSGSYNSVGGFTGFIDSGVGVINDCDAYSDVGAPDSSSVGGFLGQYAGSSTSLEINNSAAYGDVSGNNDVGGFAGIIVSDVIAGVELKNTCSISDMIEGTMGVGGFAGTLDGTQSIVISESYARCENLSGDYYIGGFVGSFENANATISVSYSRSDVRGSMSVGGFVGTIMSGGVIDRCAVYGSVGLVTTSNVGGFVGYFGNFPFTINDSYVVASVTGNASVGGVVGNYQAGNNQLTNIYSASTLSGTTNVGSFIGLSSSAISVEYCYFDTELSVSLPPAGSGNVSGATGLTTLAMTWTTSYPSWSIVAGMGTGTIWRIDGSVNDGYPHLREIYTRWGDISP